MKNSKFKIQKVLSAIFIFNFAFLTYAKAQELPPAPSAPRAAKIPVVAEKKLPTGLTVVTAQRKNVPLVTVQLMVKTGANGEERVQAGLANLTASMLTKGTKTRTASQIAEQIEFLGGSIASGAGWNNSILTVTVTSDKLDAAMAIVADVVLNPKFDPKELDLLKSQTLDGLAYSLKQPGFLANYAASAYSFGEHPAGGTPETIRKITVQDVARFKKENYIPESAVLIFTGDITGVKANALAQKFFGNWRNTNAKKAETINETLLAPPLKAASMTDSVSKAPLLERILVIDLPDAGQAAVNFTSYVPAGRIDNTSTGETFESNPYFYPALVFNSVFGGGYSSRLNQEIRIKRGLSYGAGSNFAWRIGSANFSTSTQTKNESAAEVAELVLAEIRKIADSDVPESELAPRKLVLTGDFGREMETTATLAQTIAALYTYDLPLSELNSHIKNINEVTNADMSYVTNNYLKRGDLVIVGDYRIFKDDLAKRFPNMQIEVVKADDLDLSKENLRK